MKDRLRRLERKAEGHYIIIPQLEGPPAKFPESAAQEAFLASLARLKGNLDIPEHPLSMAAANSPDSHWRGSFVAGTHTVTRREPGEPIPDLSE
jgi:hypothetical protein